VAPPIGYAAGTTSTFKSAAALQYLGHVPDLPAGISTLAGVLVGGIRTVDHRRVLLDLGCYEERYRLTSSAVLGLVASLLIIGAAFWLHGPVIPAVIVVLAFLAMQARGVFFAARRVVAFRADPAGITLGAVPGKLSLRGGSAVFVPWADVEQIILYPAYPADWRRRRYAEARCIGVRRRKGAPALAQGNEQAPGCPVPGVASGVTRKIMDWHLDRERLATVTAALAPGIPIIDAGTGPGPSIKGRGPASTTELGPAD
jgi:hypothetical protein